MKSNFEIHKVIFSFIMIFNMVFIFIQSANAQMYWNQACQFAGNSSSYIAVPNSSSLDLLGSFTIEAWVNPTTLSGSSKGIVSKGGTLGTSLKYGIRLNGSGRISAITNGAERLVSKSSTPLQAGKWTHVAVTYNAFFSQFIIYLNGAIDTSSIVAGATPTTNSDSLFIGISGASTPFNGKLDEVRIWKKVVSSTDVAKYYRTSLGVSTGTYLNLILSHTFQNDDASGTLFSLHDWTENSNNGFGRNVTPVNQSDQLYSTIDHNESAEFDGNEDYLESVDILDMDFNVTNYFIMQCWVYPRSGSQSSLITTSGSDFSLFINSDGKIQASVEGEIYNSGTVGAVPLNRWTHIAFTMNEQYGKFYFNGKLIYTDTTGFPNLIPTDNKLYVGGGPGAIPDFNGFIDEVRIASTSFIQTQIINEMYISLDKKFRVTPNYTEYAYNLDGLLTDNMKDGGPRLEFKGNAKFSHPSAIPNQPVSPLTRKDDTNFAKGFYTKHSNKRIPATGNSGTIVDSFTINKSLSISDVNLFIALNHSNLNDLSVTLTGPEGDSMAIFSFFNTNSLNNNLITVFDDNSINALNNGLNTTFTPSVRAQFNLNPVFSGKNSQGYWKIKITDNGTADTGRLYAWGVQINNMPERESNLYVNALIQGFYNANTNTMVKDSMEVYLWINAFGNHLLDSSIALLNEHGEGLFSIKNSSLITNFGFVQYFIQVSHRNAIETWSNPPAHYVVFNGFDATYDFKSDDSKAFGNNMVIMNILPVSYAFYSGDENQDGIVDLTDVVNVFNDGNVFLTGYVTSDMNGDNITDLTDVVITLNNANDFVSAVIP